MAKRICVRSPEHVLTASSSSSSSSSSSKTSSSSRPTSGDDFLQKVRDGWVKECFLCLEPIDQSRLAHVCRRMVALYKNMDTWHTYPRSWWSRDFLQEAVASLSHSTWKAWPPGLIGVIGSYLPQLWENVIVGTAIARNSYANDDRLRDGAMVRIDTRVEMAGSGRRRLGFTPCSDVAAHFLSRRYPRARGCDGLVTNPSGGRRDPPRLCVGSAHHDDERIWKDDSVYEIVVPGSARYTEVEKPRSPRIPLVVSGLSQLSRRHSSGCRQWAYIEASGKHLTLGHCTHCGTECTRSSAAEDDTDQKSDDKTIVNLTFPGHYYARDRHINHCLALPERMALCIASHQRRGGYLLTVDYFDITKLESWTLWGHPSGQLPGTLGWFCMTALFRLPPCMHPPGRSGFLCVVLCLVRHLTMDKKPRCLTLVLDPVSKEEMVLTPSPFDECVAPASGELLERSHLMHIATRENTVVAQWPLDEQECTHQILYADSVTWNPITRTRTCVCSFCVDGLEEHCEWDDTLPIEELVLRPTVMPKWEAMDELYDYQLLH
jgi:hypothetical protein